MAAPRREIVRLVVATVLLVLLAAAGGARAESAASRRIVALGDIHGDVEQLRAALVMAQLIDNTTAAKWIGGPNDKLVQVGDMLDRGPQDKQVLEEMMRLQREAAAAGSGFVVLMGNHEAMNLRRQVHYVHPDTFEAFGGKAAHERSMAPDGEFGAWLRKLPVAHVDMGTVFVHAGLLPEYARRGIDALNAAATAEIAAADTDRSLRSGSADDVLGVNGPVWTRRIVHRAQQGDCRLVREAIGILGVDRMVVGHTPQTGGTLGDFCDTQLVVVDVGMSKWMYGNLAMLELTQPNRTAAGPDGEAVPADVELREILPHTALAPEEPAGASSIDEELARDPVRLQEIFDTVRQAQAWPADEVAPVDADESTEKKAAGDL